MSLRSKKALSIVLTIIFLIIGIILSDKYLFTPQTNLVAKPTLTVSPSPFPTRHVFSEKRLWDLINTWRIDNGYRNYQEDIRLCNLAKERIIETRTSWGHDKFYEHNYDFYHDKMSENIIEGYITEERTLQGWLNSPSHAAALADDYDYSCLKCEGDRCVQIFGNFLEPLTNETQEEEPDMAEIIQEQKAQCQEKQIAYSSCMSEYTAKMEEYNSCLIETGDYNSWKYNKTYLCSKPYNFCQKPYC